MANRKAFVVTFVQLYIFPIVSPAARRNSITSQKCSGEKNPFLSVAMKHQFGPYKDRPARKKRVLLA
jgi:hypothetical protein